MLGPCVLPRINLICSPTHKNDVIANKVTYVRLAYNDSHQRCEYSVATKAEGWKPNTNTNPQFPFLRSCAMACAASYCRWMSFCQNEPHDVNLPFPFTTGVLSQSFEFLHSILSYNLFLYESTSWPKLEEFNIMWLSPMSVTRAMFSAMLRARKWIWKLTAFWSSHWQWKEVHEVLSDMAFMGSSNLRRSGPPWSNTWKRLKKLHSKKERNLIELKEALTDCFSSRQKLHMVISACLHYCYSWWLETLSINSASLG